MKTDSTLLPCPFCGGGTRHALKQDEPWIECANCHASMTGDDPAPEWNRRATQGAATPPAPERIAEWIDFQHERQGDELRKHGLSQRNAVSAIVHDTLKEFATPPAIREPDRFEAKDETLIRKALLAFYTNKDNDHAERNRAFAIFQVLRQEVATPAPAPSIPTEQVLALLEAGGFIKAGKLELARAIIASVHPAGLAPGAVEQPDGSGGLA